MAQTRSELRLASALADTDRLTGTVWRRYALTATTDTHLTPVRLTATTGRIGLWVVCLSEQAHGSAVTAAGSMAVDSMAAEDSTVVAATTAAVDSMAGQVLWAAVAWRSIIAARQRVAASLTALADLRVALVVVSRVVRAAGLHEEPAAAFTAAADTDKLIEANSDRPKR